jgi:hypothetical protein
MEYIPLHAAVKRYGIEEKVLTQLISAGMIETKTVSGGILVAVDKDGSETQANEYPQTKEEIITNKFAHLRGQPISASEASRKYSDLHQIPISNQLFSRWGKAGYITVLDRGYRLQMDEADVAYCAEIFAQKYKEYNGQLRGVSVFEKNGDPYCLKYKDLARKKRVQRHQTNNSYSKIN